MKKLMYIGFISLLLIGVSHDAWARKKKGEKKAEKKETLTAYDKLFKGKKAVTADGFMKMHLMNGKVYVEFPLNLLNKDMMLTSSIEDISDNGEGVVGQFAGRGNHFRFTKLDSLLQARLVLRRKVKNLGMGENADDMIERSNTPGIFQSYRIEAYTPDSTAVVVDMTKFFMESSRFTNPFSSYAGNSLFGFIQRVHKFQEHRSGLLGIKANEDNIVVTCNLGFNVDRLVFGAFLQAKDVPVSVTVNKILLILPEEPMRPRLADSRIGVSPVVQSELCGVCEGIKQDYLTKRWRLEPVDEERYSRGELVDVKKPIVFYIDTLMPEAWKKYVKEGAEAWNDAFEKIGLKNVIQAVEFPKDPSFDANNIRNSTIRYSPLWMYFPQTSMHTDPRTGEILNASVYMHANMASVFYTSRTEETMVADPSVRKARLSDEQTGEMIKAKMMQVIGRCLGLTDNYAASSAYPVDSLRSVSFTRKYGIVPSVMDDFPCNRIAQPEDVKNGVLLVQDRLGEYDYEVIKYLYKPIPGVKEVKAEKPVLEKWIKEMQAKPYCVYRRNPDSWAKFDPKVVRGDLGDDPIKAMNYMLPNMKGAIKNFFEWYKEGDLDMEARRLFNMELTGLFTTTIRPLMIYIGGIEIFDVEEGDQAPSYKVIPKATQRKVLKYLFDLSKDLSWIDNKEVLTQMQISDLPSLKMRNEIFNGIMSRFRYVGIAAQKSGGDYTQEEFIQDIYDEVWKNTIRNRPLTKHDMDMEQLFLASIIATSCVDAPATVFAPQFSDGLRSLNPLEIELVNQMQVQEQNRFTLDRPAGDEFEEVAGYSSIPYFEAFDGSTAHIYLEMLFKTRDLINRALVNSSGETKLHYELMLYRIKKALKKN